MAKAAQGKTVEQQKADLDKLEEEEKKLAKERQEARYNDPNKSDEDREKERREKMNMGPDEDPAERAMRIGLEKRAEADRREKPEDRLVRIAKEEKAMRDKGGTVIREVKSDQVGSDGEEVVSIRELEEPEGRGDQQPNQKENVKEKRDDKGNVKK